MRPNISANILSTTLKYWANFINLIFELLISFVEARLNIFALLYHYRYFNEIDLIDLSYIDFIIHRIRISPNTKSVLNIYQKRWPIYIE